MVRIKDMSPALKLFMKAYPWRKVKGGDWSWRTIPPDCDVQTLEEHHNSDSFDHSGIATTGITAIPEVTAAVGLPRALEVPYALGFPLGESNNPELQQSILLAALSLTKESDIPMIARFTGDQRQ